jgi:N-carbamoylputrescine amidase
MSDLQVVSVIGTPLPSPAREQEPSRAPLRVAAVQQRFHSDPDEHEAALAAAVGAAADLGAAVVCLHELTLSPYLAIKEDDRKEAAKRREALETGPTTGFARRMARRHDIYVHASLYEEVDGDERGYNTAICVSPDGELVTRARKLHIPSTAGYFEDDYFRPGETGFPTVEIGEARFGFPTCWDQWFPEVSRAYALDGAEVLVYPTAIGSEPDHPEFDTQPLWEQIIRAQGIANGTFMIGINRVGEENGTTFYGSSFMSDPYGRVLVRAPRELPAVLVTDLDLDQRCDWLGLFPLLSARRPEVYGRLLGR